MSIVRWNVKKALEAAKMKLKLSLQIKDDILSTLPATLLEVYEMIRLAQVIHIFIIILFLLSGSVH